MSAGFASLDEHNERQSRAATILPGTDYAEYIVLQCGAWMDGHERTVKQSAVLYVS